MSLSVRTKVFLVLLVTSLIAVAGTAVFVHWAMQQGLAELMAAREERRIEAISERLIDLFASAGSWDALAGDRRLWIDALTGRGGQRIATHRVAPPGHRDRGPGHMPPWARHAPLGRPDAWPPLSSSGRDTDADRPLPLELRLMLLAADGEPVYGRRALIQRARQVPLELDGRTVGTLAILPGPPVPELSELHYRSRQGGRLWIIVGAMVILSALLALALSRRLVRPLAAFQDGARRLAGGDYSARVAVSGRDEVARLGADINALAAALEQHEAARRRWVVDISHELRTPVSLLRAELEALQDGVRPLNANAVDRLHGDVLRMTRLVDDLYQLSLTDLGGLGYRMEPTDIGAVLEDTLEGFRERFRAAGLGLHLEDRRPLADRGGRRPADPERLAQLFGNLLGNSLSYTDPGGALRVVLEQDPEGLGIIFSDGPPGVADDALPRLFERLYRGDASRGRNRGGAGLGLAIARNIVEAHGGVITARHAPEGGLELRILFPEPPS